MPRIRVIKPQFWIDEGLAGLCREARLLYIGLWILCDDRGVFEYRAAKIRVQLFPYDTDLANGTVDEWLMDLTKSGHIIYFQEGPKDYGYIPTFLRHQEIKKPSKWSFTTNLPESGSAAPLPHQLPTIPPPATQQRLEVRGKRYKVRGISKEKNETPDETLPDFINRETWKAYIEMRHKQNKPPTAYALEQVIAKLQKLRDAGDDPNEVLNQSIISGWAGVFPVKEAKSGKARHSRNLPKVYTEPDDYPDD